MRALLIALVLAIAAGCSDAASESNQEEQTRPGAAPREVPLVSPEEERRLRLTRRLPNDYRAVCAEHAAYAPAVARVCPPLIPAGRVDVLAATSFSSRRERRGGYLADLASRSVDKLRGAALDTNGGHWHYDVSWTPPVTSLLVGSVVRPVNATRASSCRPARLGENRIQTCRVVPYRDGGGLHGDHIAYIWRSGGATFVISVHDYRNEPRARAMMAALIGMVVESRHGG